MADALRRILYPTFVLTCIATVWTLGWAKAASEQAQRRYFPALNPQLFQFEETAGEEASISSREL